MQVPDLKARLYQFVAYARAGIVLAVVALCTLGSPAMAQTITCLGRPVVPLVFDDPVPESPGATVTSPSVGDVFRFPDVAPGFDALVEVTSFNNGATLQTIDNDGAGLNDNLQPSMLATATGDASVDFEITIVASGTSTLTQLDFVASAIDVDGNSNGLTEYAEVSSNIVEFALNGVFTPAPVTRLISQATTPPSAGASAPSSANRVRFEAETDDTAAGIDPNEPRNIVAAFFTDVSVFEYRVGKLGVGTGGAARLNSLAFNCPNITPTPDTTTNGTPEDFGDAPISYGNPIHVVDPAVRLGATNTDEIVPGNSPAASSDAGDDGVTISGTSFQGATLQGLVSQTIDVAVTNTSPSTGFLQAFFDWNGDGDFADAGEQAVIDAVDGDNDGTITLSITPPAGTVAGSSFARFRWATSSVSIQDPTADGEVEDYQITVLAADPADLSLTIDASNTAPGIGQTVTLTVTITNDGPGIGTGISASVPLPAGLTFVSSDGGAAYDEATGVWTLPTDLATGESATLEIEVTANALGTSVVQSQIINAVADDLDSTPGNAGAEPDEDDTDSVTITTTTAPPVCPAGLVLMNAPGTATSVVSQTNIGNANFALGALSPEGTAPPNPVAAFVNIGASSLLVLDLGAVIPANALLTFSLARDGGGAGNQTRLEIRTSLDAASFTNVFGEYGDEGTATLVSTGQDVLERFTVPAPVGGVQFLQFDILNGDNGFVDGISYEQICVEGGELQGGKTVEVFDPLGEGLFALPGNDVTYTITINNIGGGATDEDSLFLIDALPPEVTFFNGDADGPGTGTEPVNFTDIVATGLDPFVFANDVAFSDATTAPADFASCNYTPTAGFDPAVTFICFNPKGTMGAGDPNPSFSLSFRARIN